MMSLRVGFCVFPCIAIRRLRTQSYSVGVLGLLLMAVGSSLYYYLFPSFVQITNINQPQVYCELHSLFPLRSLLFQERDELVLSQFRL
jgi:hypothetical protein